MILVYAEREGTRTTSEHRCRKRARDKNKSPAKQIGNHPLIVILVSIHKTFFKFITAINHKRVTTDHLQMLHQAINGCKRKQHLIIAVRCCNVVKIAAQNLIANLSSLPGRSVILSTSEAFNQWKISKV